MLSKLLAAMRDSSTFPMRRKTCKANKDLNRVDISLGNILDTITLQRPYARCSEFYVGLEEMGLDSWTSTKVEGDLERKYSSIF